MAALNKNWFVEGLQDFEYKKYVLLAYLQSVQKSFDQALLYPVFADLIAHYQDLHSFAQSCDALQNQFPRELTTLDLENLQALYAAMHPEDEGIAEVQEIIDYSLPRMHEHVEAGKELFDRIDATIEINTVGLLPLYRDAGYLLLRPGKQPRVNAYQYQVTIFEQAKERFRGIHTHYICSFDYSIANTFESIKLELIRKHKELPNPATFALNTRLEFPEQQSLIPVAKRKFIRFLARI